MSERVIPLTPPGALWSQREYVECMRLGIEFAAHRYGELHQVFHYGFPEDIGCTSIIFGYGPPLYIDHNFGVRPLDWIERCAAAIPKP